MALFKIGARAAGPLKIQLGTPATIIAEVRGIVAGGDNATGAASRPLLTRPSTAGTGTGTIVPIDSPVAVSGCTGITSFVTSPPAPTSSASSANLPIRVNIQMPRGNGFVVGVSSYAYLFANATGGHTWTGELIFEEL